MTLCISTGHHLHLNLSRNTVIRVKSGLLVLCGISLLISAMA